MWDKSKWESNAARNCVFRVFLPLIDLLFEEKNCGNLVKVPKKEARILSVFEKKMPFSTSHTLFLVEKSGHRICFWIFGKITTIYSRFAKTALFFGILRSEPCHRILFTRVFLLPLILCNRGELTHPRKFRFSKILLKLKLRNSQKKSISVGIPGAYRNRNATKRDVDRKLTRRATGIR